MYTSIHGSPVSPKRQYPRAMGRTDATHDKTGEYISKAVLYEKQTRPCLINEKIIFPSQSKQREPWDDSLPSLSKTGKRKPTT